MQRLFSTFPNSWPGAGLMLVRMCLGTALIWTAISDLSLTTSEPPTLVRSVVAATGGVLLLVGLWTPLTGVLMALEETWKSLALGAPVRDVTWTHGFLAVLSLGVAMLGPGAWSIDALLFGRRRFDIDRA